MLALDAFRGWAPLVELGEGGLERWIVYPIVLWLVAFGSYLLAAANLSAAEAIPQVRELLERSRLTCRSGCMPNQSNQALRGTPWP